MLNLSSEPRYQPARRPVVRQNLAGAMSLIQRAAAWTTGRRACQGAACWHLQGARYSFEMRYTP
jgi:hypothetical protein